MSESSFPFEGSTMTNSAGEDFSSAGGGDRRKLFVLAGLAGILVVAVAAYFLLFADAGADDVAKPVGTPVVVAPEVGPAPAASTPVKKERLSAKSFGNDPFEALITVPVAAVVAPAPAAPALGTTPVITAPLVSAAAPAAATPSSSEAHTFKVVEVAPDNGDITVKVDGKRYNKLQAGEVFGTYFKVVLISGQVNSFQFGEEKFNVIGTKRLTIA